MRAVAFGIPLVFALLILSQCSETPVPPVQQHEPDTTSHEIVWDITYIGEAQTSLYKIFKVNDTTVYTVGRIYMRDSTGRLESDAYNAARWNGEMWTPVRIPIIICGTGVTRPFELRTGFGFTDNRVHFFTLGSLAERVDTGYRYDCDMQYKLYGTIQNVFTYSSDDYYIVGGNSTILHWDGSSFSRQETGTTWETRDIFGNAFELWAVAGSSTDYRGGVLYKQRDKSWGMVDSLSDGYKRSINSTWCDQHAFDNAGFVIFAGRGIWYKDTIWKRPPAELMGGHLGMGDLYFNTVRGAKRNDVFAAGHFGILLHYNGSSWRFYPEVFKYPGTRVFESIAMTKKHIFICGMEDGKGMIIKGKLPSK